LYASQRPSLPVAAADASDISAWLLMIAPMPLSNDGVAIDAQDLYMRTVVLSMKLFQSDSLLEEWLP
jgi:hypothetical protein